MAIDFADNQSIGIDPKWLDGVLAWVEEAGGIRSYLRHNSVSDADVESLIQQATEPQVASGK